MRRVKLVLAAMAAVVALSAVASATASAAAPEFKPASGKFTSTSGAGTLQIKGGNTVECTSDTDKGEITGAKTAKVTIDFSGCKLFGFIGAHTTGDSSGVILVEGTGTLGKISGTKIGLAIAIKEITIETGIESAHVKGTVIGEVTPTGKKTKTGELILKQSGGKQEITKFEGESGSKILEATEGSSKEEKEAGEETTDKITYETETEITN